MQRFNIGELAKNRKSDQENDQTLSYFSEIAFPTVPAAEIISILKKNYYNWESVWVRKGKADDHFEYTDRTLREASHTRENIISLIILGDPGGDIFMHDLKEYADDFAFTAVYISGNEKLVFILYFVNK